MIFGKNKLVFIVNLIRHDFHLWKIPTISIDSDSFCQLLSQQKGTSVDGSHCVTNNPQLSRKNFREKLLSSANTSEYYIVCKDYCIAQHGDKI